MTRVYQFEIVYNAVTTYGSYPSAASIMLTLVKSTYFNETDINFVAEKIHTKNIGGKNFMVCPSDTPYLSVYFNTHGDDVYYIVAVSDNMVEAESFVESIEIQ